MLKAARSLIVLMGLVGILRATAKAADLPYPGHQCDTSCTAPVRRIWDAFELAGPLNVAAVSGRVYSGACYHQGRNYDGLDVHYGVVYFAPVGGDLHFAGRFGFFYKSDPYAAWTPADAVRELNPSGDALSLIHPTESYSWVDFHPQQIPIMQYYLRQSGSVVELVGFWDINHVLFCELRPH